MISKIKAHFQKRKIKKAEKALHREYIKSIPSAFDENVISWVAPEHIRHERGTIWKVLAFIAVIASITLGLIYNNWTFSLSIAMCVVVYYLFHKIPPKDVNVIISNIGVKVGHRKYPFNRIKSFWIIYEPPFTKRLFIRVTGDLALDIPIELNDQNPSHVREFLMGKIPELEGQHESLIDIFSKLFKI